MNPDTVSLLENEESVFDMVYSQSSGLIYVVVSPHSISRFKWDESKKTFQKQRNISFIGSFIWSITLAPPDTFGGDQIYIPVGYKDQKKKVYRVPMAGKELKKRVVMINTKYIDDECEWWEVASNTDRRILLIHPNRTLFIYIHVREQKHGKVDLNQLHIPKSAWLQRIELIGQLLILGDYQNGEVCMCELMVTESDASIKSGNERKLIESDRGSFAALHHVMGDEDEPLHLFSVRIERTNNCTYISEYKFNQSVSSSDPNQLPMQPIRTLKVEGKFHPYCLVKVNTSSALIGEKSELLDSKLGAVELLNQQVKHHVQQPAKQCIIS